MAVSVAWQKLISLVLFRLKCPVHPVLEFAMFSTSISVAPTLVNSSILFAICFFSTMELTATQSWSSSVVIVGARLPGVIFVAVSRSARGTLYWQRTYFWAAGRKN